MTEQEKINFKNFGADKYKTLIRKLDADKSFTKTKQQLASDESHFHRLWYNVASNKLILVYDTKANMLSVTTVKSVHQKLAPYLCTTYPQKSAENVDNSTKIVDNFVNKLPVSGGSAMKVVTRSEQLAWIEKMQQASAKKDSVENATPNSKSQTPDKSTSKVGATKKANGKQSQAEVKTANGKQSQAEVKTVNGKQSQAGVKTANGKQSQTEVKKANGKQSQAEVKTANGKQSQAGVKTANGKQSQTEVKKANGKQSQAEVKTANGKQSQAEVKTANGKQSQTEAKKANGKQSQAEVKKANGKQSQAGVKTADNNNAVKANKQAEVKKAKLKAIVGENKQGTDSKAKTTNSTAPSQNGKVIIDDKGDKNNFSLKKYPQNKLDKAFVELKKLKIKVKQEKLTDKSTPSETRTFILSLDDNKLKLRFMPKKQVLQLQGKDNKFMNDVQSILLEGSDFKTSVDALREKAMVKQNFSSIDKKLKKQLPNALAFLTEVSKMQFANGIIELMSNSSHTDYSIILLPTCRGLERLIYDLQQAKNIDVKLIGQAYEKVPNGYELKDAYKRKINSVVYAEVMSALYNEYFRTRNYYMHSDNSIDGDSRIISTKQEVIDIASEIMAVVDYNCKKLAEINFSL